MGLVGDILGGANSSKAAKKASKAQVQAAQVAADTQREIFGDVVKLQGPQLQAGATATDRYLTLLGLQPAQPTNAMASGGTPTQNGFPPTGNAFVDNAASVLGAQNQPANSSGINIPQYNLSVDPNDPDFGKYAHDFTAQDFLANEDPGYGFRYDEGLKALQRAFAAKGNYLSGAMIKGAENYGQGAASQEYANAFNRYQINRANQLNPLENLMGVGNTSAKTLSASAQNTGDNISQLQNYQGQARASGYLGSANAWNNALSNVNNSLSSIFSAVGGG